MKRLRAFELLEPAGQGGMATVWRARHVDTGVPVAIKLVDKPLDKESRALFRREVRGQASLRHPGIAMVLDYGTTPSGLWGIEEGTQWVALEWAGAGHVGKLLPGAWPWPLLRSMLLALLDALGHSHASGLVHRDVKPANIMIASQQDLRPGLKLCDFGIAASASQQVAIASWGTPRFMAPEHLKGELQKQGPWTDLYSTGIVAWRLAHYAYPHQGDLMRLIWATQQGPPSVNAPAGYPSGFQAWLERMLCADIDHRYQSAAEAARGLLALGEGEGPFEVKPEHLALFQATGGLAPLGSGRIQTSWERGAVPPIPIELTNVGLGVWSVKQLPLIGRRTARKTLWSSLCRADASGRPQVVVVRGADGVGKTFLGQWLGERAMETGAAGHWKLGSQGFSFMTQEALGVLGLTPEQRAEAIADRVRRLGGTVLDAAAVDALASETRMDASGRVKLSSAREQLSAFARMLTLQSKRGPVVVRITSRVRLGDAVRVAMLLRDVSDALAIVVLVEVRDSAATGEDGAMLAKLVDSAGVKQLRLQPLGPRERIQMLRAILPLSLELENEVLSRCDGNPSLMAQMVKALMAQKAVHATPRGLALLPGHTLAIPADLLGTWQARIDGLIGFLPPSAREAVELAAVLGTRFSLEAWLSVSPLGADEGLQLVQRLLQEFVWTGHDEGVVGWSHGMAREAMLAAARKAGRLGVHHGRVADVLSPTAGVGEEQLQVGRHLFEAGRYAEALELLGDAALACFNRTSQAELAALAKQIEKAIAEVCPPEHHRSRVRLSQVLARIAFLSGDPSGPVDHLEGALACAEKVGDQALAWEVKRDLLVAMRCNGSHADGILLAPGLVEAAASEVDRLDALRVQGWLYAESGQLAEGREVCERGLDILEKLEPAEQQLHAHILNLHGTVLMYLGEADEAERSLKRYLPFCRAAGDLQYLGSTWNLLGEIARGRGDLDDAEAAYEQAIEYWDPRGSSESMVARVNLGLTAVARGDGAKALRIAHIVELKHTKITRAWLGSTTVAMEIAGYALIGDVEAATARAPTLGACLPDSLPTPDVPWLIEQALPHLTPSPIGAELRVMAVEEWRRGGRPDEADRLAASAGDASTAPA